MTTATHNMAGLLASAGAARLGAGSHRYTAWTQGSIAMPSTTCVVFDRKNRPTRPLSELSP